MAYYDLAPPQTQQEVKNQIGTQAPHQVLRTLGMALLGMVAVHYGSYALKNAGARLIAQHLDDVTFTARRTTSIAEDLFGVGRKLDAFAETKMGQAEALGNLPGSSFTSQFVLRAQARAAKQAKRFPFEFIPAAAVTAYTTPSTSPDGSQPWDLKNMGKTVMYYAGADILFGAAAPLLAKTQAAKIAGENMQRIGQYALPRMQKQLEPLIMKGSSGAEALGQMYAAFDSMEPLRKVPTPRMMKTLWDEHGKPTYKSKYASLSSRADLNMLPTTLHRGANFTNAIGGKNAARAAEQDDYLNNWIDGLKRASNGQVDDGQAEALYNAVITGQDKTAFRPNLNFSPEPLAQRTPVNWYERFTHTKDSIDIAYEHTINPIIKNPLGAPGLAGKSRADLDNIFKLATEHADNQTYKPWKSAGLPGNAPRSATESAFKRGGLLEERALYRTVRWMEERAGRARTVSARGTVVEASKESRIVSALGMRRVTQGEYVDFLKQHQLDSPGLAKQLEHITPFENLVKAGSRGGEEGMLYKRWRNTYADKNLWVSNKHSGAITSYDDMVNMSFPVRKALGALTSIGAYTKIPLLNFNPLQLFQFQGRVDLPNMRWLESGSYVKPLGRIVDRPTLQLGDELLEWQGVKVRGQSFGRMVKRQERFNVYSTSPDSITGRLVRDVTWMGQDEVKRYPDEKRRFLFRNPNGKLAKLANKLDLDPYTTGSIGATVRSWFAGTPATAMYRSKFAQAHPRFQEWIGKRVEPKGFATRAKDIMQAGSNAAPREIEEFIEQIDRAFKPDFPPHIIAQADQWLPGAYSRGPAQFFKKVEGTSQAAPIPDVDTVSLIKEAASGTRGNLEGILKILYEDAIAREKSSPDVKRLYFDVLNRTRTGKSLGVNAYGMPNVDFPLTGKLEGTAAVRGAELRKNIISYLIARPTTIISPASTEGAVRKIVEIGDLEQLISQIEMTGGPLGKHVKAQVGGAVASLKLKSYKATIPNLQARIDAIYADQRIREETLGMVKDWTRIPGGKGWRTQAPDPRNAVIKLNKFADQYTYLEKFGSAWNRDPANAARGIMGKYGTKTGLSMAAFHVVSRLRNVLKLVGMDFPTGKYTSMADLLMGGFVMRRILPGMAAVEAYRWMDWQKKKRTDKGLTESAMEWGVVKPSIGMAAVAQATGLRSFAEWFGKTTGEEDRMNALKYATMTPTQMSNFWEQGEVPIRRGRWWILSQTPFEGMRTQFYVPNAYRRTKARTQYTWEGGKGPEEQYFAHSWLPNPSYPLAPLNRILDPYWFEKGSYNTRPYPLTGDFFTGPYGPAGPVLNATIGQLIKPTKKMHPEAAGSYQTGFTPYGTPIEGMMWPTPGGYNIPGSGQGFLGQGARMTHATLSAANSRTVGQAATGGATVGQPYGIGYGATMMLMGQVGVPMSVVDAATPPGIWTKTRPLGSMADSAYKLQEMGGIYGFSVQAVRERMGLSGEYQAPAYVPKASEAYGFQSRFWGAQLGGMGDITLPWQNQLSNITFSEIFRRFVPRNPGGETVNPILNSVWKQNQWLPGPTSGYFADFSHGDIYSRSMGALMLPGEAYNRLYGVNPGANGYEPMDQLRMLSKVAPWSQSYKDINRSLARSDLAPADAASYADIKRQVQDINEKYHFAPYRFKGMQVEDANYEITGVTPEGFLQARGAPTPIKLAGLKSGPELAQALQARNLVGQRVNMQLDTNRPRYSISGTQPVLEAVIPGVNKDLLGNGLQEEQGGSPLSFFARTNPLERKIGSAWESLTHMWNPLTTKFIQRRTGLEEYERTEVYGKSFAPWSTPIRSFVTPQFTSVGAKSLWGSIVTGATIGAMTGRGPGVPIMAALGGLTIGGHKVRTMIQSAITGDAYVPKNVKQRWEQEQYMDILQYVSSAKNYSLLRRRALAAGEEDPEALYQKDQAIKDWMSQQKRDVSGSVLERSVYGGVSKLDYMARNPIAAQAFSAREAMAKTEYGVELNGDLLKMQSAIPKERRMYFEQFLNAPKSDRKRILSLLPQSERRIYESAWGMSVESKPDLGDYFSSHYLPEPSAAIWTAGLDWNNMKIRMIEKAGERPSEYGFYPQEVNAAEMYPVPVPRSDMDNHGNIKAMLAQILGNTPIEGLSISVLPSSDPGFNLDMNLTRNVIPQINQMVNANMAGY